MAMVMKTTSSCFFPSTVKAESKSISEEPPKKDAQKKEAVPDATAKEKYHAGRSKWGKYKRRERESRKQKSTKPEHDGAKSNENASGKDVFDFPDGGWVCCNCQNYNF